MGFTCGIRKDKKFWKSNCRHIKMHVAFTKFPLRQQNQKLSTLAPIGFCLFNIRKSDYVLFMMKSQESMETRSGAKITPLTVMVYNVLFLLIENKTENLGKYFSLHQKNWKQGCYFCCNSYNHFLFFLVFYERFNR